MPTPGPGKKGWGLNKKGHLGGAAPPYMNPSPACFASPPPFRGGLGIEREGCSMLRFKAFGLHPPFVVKQHIPFITLPLALSDSFSSPFPDAASSTDTYV